MLSHQIFGCKSRCFFYITKLSFDFMCFIFFTISRFLNLLRWKIGGDCSGVVRVLIDCFRVFLLNVMVPDFDPDIRDC